MKLEKGQFFTVTKWNALRDRSYIGDCLEAIAVDGDFVRVRRHRNKQHKDHFTLDLREVATAHLSEDFVKAVMCA